MIRTTKKISEDLQIHIDSVNWLFEKIEEISNLAEDKRLTDRHIKNLLKQLDALENRLEWEKEQFRKMGFELK